MTQHQDKSTPQRWRKKPVVIEAWRFHDEEDIEAIYRALGDHIGTDGENVVIYTLEGAMTVTPGDWIIRGVKGEFYPCKPDIFAATYEAASSPAVNLHDAHRACVEALKDALGYLRVFVSESSDPGTGALCAISNGEAALARLSQAQGATE